MKKKEKKKKREKRGGFFGGIIDVLGAIVDFISSIF